MEGHTRRQDPRRIALLFEQVVALDRPPRPSARARLERRVGGCLARLLIGALTERPARSRA
jgi:hypothetical protein